MPRLVVSLALTLLLAAPAHAQSPDVIHLFNGKDLSTFTTWLVDDHRQDPSGVFTVVDAIDGAPAIRVSGQKYGGIATREEFESYHLVVEFRWGAVTWAPRKALARDSGVLVHCQGPDGNTKPDFNGPWMRSIEAQIIEGGVGDFILVAGSDASGARLAPELTSTVTPDRLGQFRYDPRGTPRTFTNGQRINWSGRDVDRGTATPIGFRGIADVEGHADQWTRLEVVVTPDRITNIVNGHVVNVGTNPSLKRGRIMIQSEGAEVYFRRVDLYPLATSPSTGGTDRP